MKQKILFIFLVFAGFAFAGNAEAASLSLSPATGTYNVGDEFVVDINLDTESASVDGVDLNTVNFNATLLEVVDEDPNTDGVQIFEGEVLAIVAGNTVNNQTGKITFSKLATAGSTYSGSGMVASITFKTLASGTANVNISYSADSTLDSNVASAGDDLLTTVTNASFTILGTTPPVTTNQDGTQTTNGPVIDNFEDQSAGTAISLKLINQDGTFYLIIEGQKHGVANPGMLFSYGFEFKDAVAVSEAEKALPEGSLLLPGEGALVKSPGDPTVYFISRNKKYGFVSSEVFTGLGHKFSSVLTVTAPELESLPIGDILADASARHLPGTNINDNGTIYWLGESLKYAYPSLAVFNSWNVDNDFSQVVPANAADKAITEGSIVTARILE